jgi:hypothetical protein
LNIKFILNILIIFYILFYTVKDGINTTLNIGTWKSGELRIYIGLKRSSFVR